VLSVLIKRIKGLLGSCKYLIPWINKAILPLLPSQELVNIETNLKGLLVFFILILVGLVLCVLLFLRGLQTRNLFPFFSFFLLFKSFTSILLLKTGYFGYIKDVFLIDYGICLGY